MRNIALIPAYRPDTGLPALCRKLRESSFEVVVVDDGSGLEYREIFDDIDEIVLRHPINYGKGHALRTGLELIYEMYGDSCTVVTLDADGQHTPEDAMRVIREAKNSPDTLILGSRSFDRNTPLRSRFGNHITSAVFKAVSGTKIGDTQTGLRAFSSSLIPEMLKIKGERYEYEMNVLLTFAKRKITIKELPIQTIYIENNSSSHFSPIKDSYRIYSVIAKFCGSSLLSFAIDYALFCGLSLMIPVIAANIGARLVSAGINFTLNHKVVFKSEKSVKDTLPEYIMLALVILGANTGILTALTNYTSIDPYIAKVVTEAIMFTVSFAVQHGMIFAKKTKMKLLKEEI